MRPPRPLHSLPHLLLAAAAALLAGCGRAEPATPLAIAGVEGDLARMTELLDAGAAVDEVDASGHTAAMWVARQGHPPALRLLLDRGADIEQTDRREGFRWTLLMTAIHTGAPETSFALLEWGADPGHASPRDGRTPLLMAIGDGEWDDPTPIVQALLAKGADPHVGDRHGGDPLTVAVAHGQTAVVRTLLQAAPDLRLSDGFLGTVARTLARLRGDTEILALIEGR